MNFKTLRRTIWPVLIFLMIFIHLIALAIFFYWTKVHFFRLEQLQTLNQQNIIKLQSENVQLKKQCKQNQKNQFQKQSLFEVHWLLQQAQWQIDSLSFVSSAKKYLQLAQKICQAAGWTAIDTFITQDIEQLKSLAPNRPQRLIKILHQLRSQLINNQKTDEKQLLLHPAPPTQSSKLLTTFSPFIKIERYQVQTHQVYTPSATYQLIENALLLLPQIQYAALTQQPQLYHLLLNNLDQTLQLLPFHEALQMHLDQLHHYRFKTTQSIQLHSLALVQQLIEHEKTS